MRRAVIALAASVIVLSGCSIFDHSRGEPLTIGPNSLEVGKTRRSEVLARFGPPLRVAAVNDGVAFLYEALETREVQIGVSLKALRLGFLKAIVARGEARRSASLLIFDADSVMSAEAHDSWTEDLGRGAALQLLWVALPIADTTRLEEDPPAAGWPARLLADLPVGLNLAQDLDTGAAGLEQLGTTRRVGQHTLEIH